MLTVSVGKAIAGLEEGEREETIGAGMTMVMDVVEGGVVEARGKLSETSVARLHSSLPVAQPCTPLVRLALPPTTVFGRAWGLLSSCICHPRRGTQFVADHTTLCFFPFVPRHRNLSAMTRRLDQLQRSRQGGTEEGRIQSLVHPSFSVGLTAPSSSLTMTMTATRTRQFYQSNIG
jgi:hypothetical protein